MNRILLRDATPEQVENAMRYGLCPVCGHPREAWRREDDAGRLVEMSLRCSSAECPTRVWPT